jgi:excisionase family DNA binding protein
MIIDGLDVPVMWDLREAAEKTPLSYDHVRRLCLQNKIKHVRVGERGTKILVNAESLVAWLQGDGD